MVTGPAFPSSGAWNSYDATTQWQDAENSGLGEIDTPGDYELHSETGLNDTVYNLASRYANSGLGYLYEDAQGRIGYADSTHRSQYLANNGYVDLDGNHAIGPALSIVKRAGDVRNAITVGYGIGSASVNDEDAASISLYGQLATTISTTLRHQADAEAQAAFYLLIRAYPQFALRQITFTTASPEIDDADRDSLLNVFMGMPLNITNLPSNMTDGEFQGFVEGWTWTAGLNRLDLTMNLSKFERERECFGCTEHDMKESIDSAIAYTDYHMIAMSMMFAWTNSYNKQVKFKCVVGAYINNSGSVMISGEV